MLLDTQVPDTMLTPLKMTLLTLYTVRDRVLETGVSSQPASFLGFRAAL